MPDSSRSPVDQSRQAWRNLGMKLASVTPKQAGRLLMGLIAVVVVTSVAVASWPALLPFVVGGIIAYTVLPLVDALDKVLTRFLAALTGVLLAIAVLAGLAYIIVPPFITQLIRLIEVVPDQAQIRAIAAGIAVNDRFGQLPPLVQKQTLEMINASLTRLDAMAAGLVPSLFGSRPVLTLINTFSNILGLVVLPTWALVLLKDQARAWPTFANVLPPAMRRDARVGPDRRRSVRHLPARAGDRWHSRGPRDLWRLISFGGVPWPDRNVQAPVGRPRRVSAADEAAHWEWEGVKLEVARSLAGNTRAFVQVGQGTDIERAFVTAELMTENRAEATEHDGNKVAVE